MEQRPSVCQQLAERVVSPPCRDELHYVMVLQRQFGERFCDFETLDDAGRVEATQYYLACIANELEEIRDWLPWKQHKQYKDFQLQPIEIQFEIVDVLLYLFNLCSIWGMDGQLLIRRILQKQCENAERLVKKS